MPHSDPPPPDNWVTISQAIATTGKSERTIRRWIATKRLTTRRESGRVLVNLADIAGQEPDTYAAPPGPPDSTADCHARIKELEADVTRLTELLAEVRGERDYLRQLTAMKEAKLLEAPPRRRWSWPWSKTQD